MALHSRLGKWGVAAALCLVFAAGLAMIAPAPAAHAQTTTPAPQTQTATQQPPTQPDACAASWWYDPSAALACVIRGFYISAFTIPITLASWLLALIGIGFNYLLEYIIIGFGPNLYNLIQAPLEAIWGTFRDLANILIVGMFVFIAISIILELQEFGRKRLVVDVIIIAVLINFSLLFTKLAIDASNFVAYQFYSAALAQTAGGTTGTGTTGGGAGSVASNSIAGQLIEYMGVSSIGNTATALNTAAQGPDINAGTVAIHGIASSVVLLGAAAIFLYGSYLLIVRAIVIILLLLFSSLAFASYLIPGKSRQVFSTWLNELISVIVFAPILMLMLWATLQIAKALKVAPGGGTLGSLMTNPTVNQGGNVAALFSYAAILGLLYATFYIANSLSHKAKGMTAISGQLRLRGAQGIAGALGYGLAPLLRNTLGRAAYQQKNALEAQRTGIRRDPSLRPDEKLSKILNLNKAIGEKQQASKRDFNAMDNSVSRWLAKKAGIGTMGQTKKPDIGGFAKKAENRDKAEVDKLKQQLTGTAITKEDAQAMARMEAAKSRQETAAAKPGTAQDQKTGGLDANQAAIPRAEAAIPQASGKEDADKEKEGLEQLEKERAAAQEQIQQKEADAKAQRDDAEEHYRAAQQDLERQRSDVTRSATKKETVAQEELATTMKQIRDDQAKATEALKATAANTPGAREEIQRQAESKERIARDAVAKKIAEARQEAIDALKAAGLEPGGKNPGQALQTVNTFKQLFNEANQRLEELHAPLVDLDKKIAEKRKELDKKQKEVDRKQRQQDTTSKTQVSQAVATHQANYTVAINNYIASQASSPGVASKAQKAVNATEDDANAFLAKLVEKQVKKEVDAKKDGAET